MLIQWLLLLLALALPIAAGFALSRRKPAMGAFSASLLAGVPFMLAFLLLAFGLSQSASGPTAYALPALIVWGVVAAVMGFGLGFFGHATGAKGRRK